MKICITGGAGFIGSNIAERYLSEGHNVVIIDNLSLGFIENIPEGAKFYQMDINDDNLLKVFEDEKFDVVCHYAAQMSVRHSVSIPSDDAKTNIIGSLNIFESARKTGVKKIIFASSAGTVYGEQNEFPCSEEHQNSPVSPYGVSKYSVEKYLEYYKNVFNIQYTVLRYTNVYGRKQNPYGEAGVIAIFFLKMLRNEDTYITGDGSITRDYVYIDDVVEANVLALNPEMTGVFNVSTGIETPLLEIFDKLATLTNYQKSKQFVPFKIGEQMRSVCSYAKINKLTGWTPKMQLDEGLRITMDYYLKKAQS